jgi:16S rRNA (cytidine1402-2'-O)-methyltransferase
MASGMNGQHFQFHGYLSPKKDQIASDIRRLEEISRKDKATQIFIETPYRNQQVIETAIKTLAPTTLLCIGVDLTSASEMVRTLPISKWRKISLPELHKRPAVFCLEAK